MEQLLVMAPHPCRNPASRICHSLRRDTELCLVSPGLHLHWAAAVERSLGHCLHHGACLTFHKEP